MSQLQDIKGNLFSSKNQTLVNAVNCVGVMGAGIALGFKLRFPAMFRRYETLCREGRMEIGKLWLYKPTDEGAHPWVLSFPTKTHWRLPSKVEYLEQGLRNFVDTYRQRGIESAAFPLLGSQNGGLSEAEVLDLMREHLRDCEIPIDIYRYDPTARDELIESIRSRLLAASAQELATSMGIGARRIKAIQRALEGEDVRTVPQLASIKGIGEKTLTRALAWVREGDIPSQEKSAAPLPMTLATEKANPSQGELFLEMAHRR